VPGEPISFRRAAAADRPLIQRLCRSYREEDRQPLAPERVARAIDAALSGDPLLHIWLIEEAGMTVGYLAVGIGFSIEVGGRDAFIDEIYLDRAARGRGIGTRALEFAEVECRAMGVMRLCLEVERHNPDARRLYDRAGYRDHERHLMSKWLD
jgi:GNAT superfamily N-acetyltransferase